MLEADLTRIFDSRWYLERNPDVADSGVNPLAHYLEQGAAEGRSPKNPNWLNFRKFGPSKKAQSEAKHIIKKHAHVEPSFRILRTADFSNIPLFYQNEAAITQCWKKIFFSITVLPQNIMLVSDIDSAQSKGFLPKIIDAAAHGGSSSDLLVIETDTNHPSVAKGFPKNVAWRSIAEFTPGLSSTDRSRILTGLIYHLQPRSIMIMDSQAAWLSLKKHGAAISSHTRVCVAISEADINKDQYRIHPDHPLVLFFRECFTIITSILVPHDLTKKRLIDDYGLSQTLSRKIRVHNPQSSKTELIHLLSCQGGFLAKKIS